MSDLAPLLEGFFTDKLARQRQASPHTIAAYRDAFKLLLGFIHQRTGRQPSQLSITDLDATTVGAFLQHLENERGNTANTRNARLAAIHVRMVARTLPGRQFLVGLALRGRIAAALRREGIHVPIELDTSEPTDMTS